MTNHTTGRTTFGGLRPCQPVTIIQPNGETNEVEFIRPKRGGEVAIVVDRDADRRFTVHPSDIVAPAGEEVCVR